MRRIIASFVLLVALVGLVTACGGGDDGMTSDGGLVCANPQGGVCQQTRDHSGCCSSHGGISTYDTGNCRIICTDGQYSPSCCW